MLPRSLSLFLALPSAVGLLSACASPPTSPATPSHTSTAIPGSVPTQLTPPTSSPSPATAPAHTASALPTPEGFEVISDAHVHLTFPLPSGWTRQEGQAPGATFAEYGPPTPATYPTFRAGSDSEPGQSPIASTVLSNILAASRSQGGDLFEIIDEYELSVGGQPAYAAESYLARSPSETYFSILVVVLGPDRRGYVLQWTSTKALESEARLLFETMLPFLHFLP